MNISDIELIGDNRICSGIETPMLDHANFERFA